jgi:cell envelope opacity-associated protein A
MADWFSCLADTKSRVSCFTADLDLADANMAESDSREVHHQPSGKLTSLVWSFGLNTPSNNTTHASPFTRRHVANVEKKSIHNRLQPARALAADVKSSAKQQRNVSRWETWQTCSKMKRKEESGHFARRPLYPTKSFTSTLPGKTY